MSSILHVSQPTTGGVSRVVLDLATAQQAAGLHVSVACPPGQLADDLARAGVFWQRWDSERQPSAGLHDERRALGRIVAATAPTIVHLHSSKAGLVGRSLLRGRVPTVFQPHAWSFLAARGRTRRAAIAWERYATRWTDMTLFCSRREQQEGVQYGIAGPGRVVLNGVDPDYFEPPLDADRRKARAALSLPQGVHVAAVVGRRSEQKGQDVAEAAWQTVREASSSAILLFMGAGYDDGFDESRRIATFAARSDVRPALLSADVMVAPSRWEGLSLSLLEGMACGRPTIASDVAGSREALLDGPLPPAGAVVEIGDPDALAREIVVRLQEPDRVRREACAARRRVELSFTQASTIASVMDVYRLLADA